jgi:hypothetical protein
VDAAVKAIAVDNAVAAAETAVVVVPKAETTAMAGKPPIATEATTAIEGDAAEAAEETEIKIATKIKTATAAAMIAIQSPPSQDPGTTTSSSPKTPMPAQRTPNSAPASTTTGIAPIAITTTARPDHEVDAVEDVVEDAGEMIKIKIVTKELKTTSATISKIPSTPPTITPTTAHHPAISADEEETMDAAKEETMDAAKEEMMDVPRVAPAAVDNAAAETGSRAKRWTTGKYQLGTMQSPA